MIEQAFISGQIGKAIYKEGERYLAVGLEHSEQPVECRPGDISLLFDCSAEFTAIPGKDIDLHNIRSQLEFDRRVHRAISLTIGGLDAELSFGTRSLSIEAAEELLQDELIRASVRARLLARLLPRIADINGAISQAEAMSAALITNLYKQVRESQRSIGSLLETWTEIAPNFFDLDEEQAQAEKNLIEMGLFADMVEAVTSGNIQALNSVFMTYGLKPTLYQHLPQGIHVMNALRARLAEKYTSDEDESYPLDPRNLEMETERQGIDPIAELITNFEKKREEWKPKTLGADEALAKVQKQINAIGNLIRRGKTPLANKFLRDLIEFNLEHGEKKHVGMTLCSLAKIAIDAYSFEMAEKLVGYAFMLAVEDVVIWDTRAELLKAMGRFPHALAAYDENVRRFPDDAITRNGRAEVLKEMGRLTEALAAYDETIGRFPESVITRNGRAEVLKEMGRLTEALAAYDENVRRFPDDAITRNGRAGVLKEMGRFDEALAAYDETIKYFPGSSWTLIDRASLLTLMGRLSEAFAVLPTDRPISKRDWIAYHIHAMCHLKSGNVDEATKRLEYGVENAPWLIVNNYFSTALSVARIKKAKFKEAMDVLQSNMFNVNISQRQKQLVLISHSQAGLGSPTEAASTLAAVAKSKNPHIIKTKDLLSRRYNLGNKYGGKLSGTENTLLEKQIFEEEFWLAMAA